TPAGGVPEVVRAREAIDRLQTRLDGARGDLDRARLEGEASLALQARFVSTLSQSIRTPMSGILGTTLELLETPLTDGQRAAAETIRASADSLLTVLNEVVDVSRIESGKVQLESIDFDLGVLVEDAIEALAPAARAKGLSLAYEVVKDVPRLLRGDPGRL